MESVKKTSSSSTVRHRVYTFGIICMVIAFGQIVMYMIMLGISVSPDHRDIQVATASLGMTSLTGVYGALTGRVLFLLYEKRYKEVKKAEWIWWFASLALVMFNSLLVIWFFMLPDYIPAVISLTAALLYILFFKFAKEDVRHICLSCDYDKVTAVPGDEENNSQVT